MAVPIEFIVGLKLLFIDILIKTILPLSIGLTLIALWAFKVWLKHQADK